MSVLTRERSDAARTPRTSRRFGRGTLALMAAAAVGTATGAGFAADALFGGNGSHGCGDTLDISEGSTYEAIQFGKSEGQVMAGHSNRGVDIGLAIGRSIPMFELHQFGSLDQSHGSTLVDGSVSVRFTADTVENGIVETIKVSCSAAPAATAPT